VPGYPTPAGARVSPGQPGVLPADQTLCASILPPSGGNPRVFEGEGLAYPGPVGFPGGAIGAWGLPADAIPLLLPRGSGGGGGGALRAAGGGGHLLLPRGDGGGGPSGPEREAIFSSPVGTGEAARQGRRGKPSSPPPWGRGRRPVRAGEGSRTRRPPPRPYLPSPRPPPAGAGGGAVRSSPRRRGREPCLGRGCGNVTGSRRRGQKPWSLRTPYRRGQGGPRRTTRRVGCRPTPLPKRRRLRR